MTEIPLAAVARIIKNIDPNIRTGMSSKEEMRNFIEEYAARLAELAVTMARNANRNTVMTQDIVSAREQMIKGIAFHQMQVG